MSASKGPFMSRSTRTIFLSATAALAVSSVSMASDDYGRDVGMKLGSGFSNIALGWVEFPKNMINTANETNVLFGISGGFLKGGLHTVGRIASGLVDVLTFPLPTEPITRPSFVWENFDVETQYGPVFKTKE
ncbi:putative exosortase-associated protein (TIGR04073 family) [Methylocaldum szegediense]|uniref:Exosortase-associated protein (TIGR04073 family) n=2 Tax=Methylocaldum szegediense TaxID=73780 RepID=A0ABM9I210_9GAMM|nr:putative exosortase-associated protein (TIGR04073 family) [Methylocaldum szegediense]